MIWTIALTACWVAVGFAIDVFFSRFPCTCGRAHHPYFHAHHNRLWTMVTWAVICTIFAVSSILAIDWFGSLLLSLWATFQWRGVYFHEKGKHRKLGRALGRIRINSHGRLVTTHE